MKRGELWTVAGGSPYTNKFRPALVIQDDQFSNMDSVIICPLSTNKADANLFRPALMPNDQNGISQPSRVMIDKIAALRKDRFGQLIGHVERRDMVRVERALALVLGIASPVSAPLDDE